MRVLFWSDLYWPYIGGAEIFGMRLLAALRERGVEFLVITSHHDRELPDDDEHDGIAIRRLPFRTAIGARNVRALLGAIGKTAAIKREFAPDLIHMNAIGPSALVHLRTQNASGAPLLATVQQEVLATQSGGESTLLAQIVTSARWVTGVSQTVLEQLRSAHPSIAPRSSCIYNGIDPPALAPAPLPEAPHVLCLGRLVRRKASTSRFVPSRSLRRDFRGRRSRSPETAHHATSWPPSPLRSASPIASSSAAGSIR